MKRFGPQKDFDKPGQFFQRMSEYGNAIFHGPGCYITDESIDFVSSQFDRFGVAIEGVACDICAVGPAAVTELIDYYDPYLLFFEYSDVTMTDEWCEFAYEMTEDGLTYWELDPEHLETFRVVPGQADAFFNYHMARPGVDAFPAALGESLKKYINECILHNIHFGPYYDFRSATAQQVYEDLASKYKTEDGYIDEGKVMAHFDLALWSATLWIFGPLGRELRVCGSDVTEAAVSHGECIIYDGEVITPEYYRRVNRPPNSCYKCGIGAWCLDTTIDDFGALRHICESCLSLGMKPRNGATCGTKFCRYFDCPHNAYFQAGTAAVRDVMRKQGQLAKRSATRREALGAVAQDRRLLGT